MSADTPQKKIVSGDQWPVASQPTINTFDYEDEVVRQLRPRLGNLCLLAYSFFNKGLTVVLEDNIVGWRLTDLREALADVDVMFYRLIDRRG